MTLVKLKFHKAWYSVFRCSKPLCHITLSLGSAFSTMSSKRLLGFHQRSKLLENLFRETYPATVAITDASEILVEIPSDLALQ